MLILAYKIQNEKYINKTETKQKQRQTMGGIDQVSRTFIAVRPVKNGVLYTLFVSRCEEVILAGLNTLKLCLKWPL